MTLLSRRSFLGGAAAFGASALIPQNRPQRIDVHHHITPPAFLSFLSANGQGRPIEWTLSKSLEDMDEGGTATALTSITSPGIWFGDVAGVRKVARDCNDYAAKLRTDYSGRFGIFATLPLPDVEGSIRETEYALDTLKADGVCMWTNYEDKWLGDPAFDPLYAELNRRKAIVYTHPKQANCCRGLVPNISEVMVEYGTSTTRSIASLIFGGTTTRFPDIQFIFSHAGGTMPFLIERFLSGTAAEVIPGIVTKGQGGTGVVGSNPPRNAPKGVLAEIRKMYYDVAQQSNPIAMQALRSVVPVSQIVFGTDYPYRSTSEHVRGLVNGKVFNAQELRAIDRDNAVRLLPKYRS
jgi:predicted TIM-barrel fold metal-dependent hydrolase